MAAGDPAGHDALRFCLTISALTRKRLLRIYPRDDLPRSNLRGIFRWQRDRCQNRRYNWKAKNLWCSLCKGDFKNTWNFYKRKYIAIRIRQKSKILCSGWSLFKQRKRRKTTAKSKRRRFLRRLYKRKLNYWQVKKSLIK